MNGFARTLTVALGACLVVLSAACDTTPCGACADSLLGTAATGPNLWSAGKCSFDLSGDKAETVCFVLGFLHDSSAGRTIVEDDDAIEGFYGNEGEKAALFRKYLVRLAHEQGIDEPIVDEKRDQGVRFHSRALTSGINSCYSYRLTWDSSFQLPDGSAKRTARGTLSLGLFARRGEAERTASRTDGPFDPRRALPFLAGAYTRWGADGAFVFPGRPPVVDVIGQLLANFRCRDVRIETTVGFIPGRTRVLFQPTDEIKAWLQKKW